MVGELIVQQRRLLCMFDTISHPQEIWPPSVADAQCLMQHTMAPAACICCPTLDNMVSQALSSCTSQQSSVYQAPSHAEQAHTCTIWSVSHS